ncbi:MAG: Hsp70 family protein [Pirellulales bacterium]|nr:Hsp70 family protein [Pirellulales bacterium]
MSSRASDRPASRYVVGMDLGTTNSAVSFVDTWEMEWQVENFSIPQLVAPATIESRETLPSFHYQPQAGEFAPGALKLPWSSGEHDFCVGVMARDFGGMNPGRQILSAKSWLCHTGVNRTAELLPWHAAPDVSRLSPVEVSARYLGHVRAAWDARYAEYPLAEQDFVLTLPASFDEVARELTIAAAARAGLPRVVLIEEPQAAFYAWLNLHRDTWETHVRPGQLILVCDIGGGTSDFTLIRARGTSGGTVQFQRIAVGEHLILGGDNLDLALAKHLEQRAVTATGQAELSVRQWDTLVRACRRVKETLLANHAPPEATISLAGGGSRLLANAVQISAEREEVRQLLCEGFLPYCQLGDSPRARRSGFQEFGLPYAADPAMTRHLAAFLSAHRQTLATLEEDSPDKNASDPCRPDLVLFNGGFFHSPLLQTRLLEVLENWFNGVGSAPGSAWRPRVLANERLDLAVARGAAYYGMVLRGHGVRIAADLARTYYLGVSRQVSQHASPSDQDRDHVSAETETVDQAASTRWALCVVPATAEPGEQHTCPRELELRIAQPIEFPLYVSSTRLTDPVGAVMPVETEQFRPLAPIRTVMQARGGQSAATVPVQVQARLSEIGTLELWCAESAGHRRWQMQFDVRSATQTDRTAHRGTAEQAGFLDETAATAALDQLTATFGPGGGAPLNTLNARLTEAIQRPRAAWPPSLLRRIWQTLVELENGRRQSPAAEARWLNLLGYALRPGFGLALDDWRVAETWKMLFGKLAHHQANVQNEGWILWRRIAGGLTAGQQAALANPLLPGLRGLHKRLTTGQGGAGDLTLATTESLEVWRLLGSLELLSAPLKIELGRIILDLLPRKKLLALRPALLWMLGRLGARVPAYGPLNIVLGSDVVADWLADLKRQKADDPQVSWVIMQLARRTDDRYRDLSSTTRQMADEWLRGREAPESYIRLVTVGGELAAAEQTTLFGEELPIGLSVG